uniref:Uncharacterized protein n=1 Tax=Cacopsylla melanoneura TaxID=428564 RepID=A0A8D8LP25_9HEMI
MLNRCLCQIHLLPWLQDPFYHLEVHPVRHQPPCLVNICQIQLQSLRVSFQNKHPYVTTSHSCHPKVTTSHSCHANLRILELLCRLLKSLEFRTQHNLYYPT